MHAYQIDTPDGIDAIQRIELPDPEPNVGEVLVRIRANSLNFRDLTITRGGYARNEKQPVIPLSDGAGEVVAVGDGVTRFQPGDRVVASFFRDWVAGDVTEELMHASLGGGIDGTLCELVCLPERAWLHVPEHLSFEEAATLPCAAVTAWQALVSLGRVKAGDVVLTLGTGGVSIFALQFAKLHGATVIITSSSDEKLERAKQLGADYGINYKTSPDWHDEARRLTGGRGVDHVVEVGGPGTFERSLAATAVSGRVSLIGVLTGAAGAVNPMTALFNRITVQGIYVGSVEMFAAMNRAIAASELRPVIDRTFGFDEALEAYRHLKSGKHFGKVVVTR
ncbi:MAG: NAD(P)-dependent alcohol dehydrogenase [Planctomycetaceae bacterium]